MRPESQSPFQSPVTREPMGSCQSPKILFPGPLIQPVNSSERAREDTKTNLLSLLQSDFGFHCFSVGFFFCSTSGYGYVTSTFPTIRSPSCHSAPYLPHPPQIFHNLCFLFLLVITAVPREIENNASAKFLGANKVHYG